MKLVELTSPLTLISLALALAACSGGPIGPGDGGLDGDSASDGDLDADSDSDDGGPGDADLDAGDDGDPDDDADLDAEVDDADVDEDLPDCPTGWDETLEEPTEVLVGEEIEGAFPRCETAQRFAVIPRDTEVLLELGDLPEGTLISIVQLDGEVLETAYVTSGEAAVIFTPSRSGEVRIQLHRPDGKTTPTYRGRLSCLDGCDREATRYPIVLCHGMAGTDYYAGFLGYFYQVPETLREMGYQVFTPVVSAVGPSDDRAEALAPQIDEILAETGAPRVHLFGHSQGGLDIRVLVSGLGYADRTASMTTFATPHRGIRTELPGWLTGQDFSEDYITGEFAATYPDVESIPRFSWTGESCPLLDLVCQSRLDGEVVDALFAVTILTVQAAHADDPYEGANDGLVPIASAQWGEFLGIVFADHMDEVGQLADDPDSGPFRHVEFYIEEARRLRQLELDRGL